MPRSSTSWDEYWLPDLAPVWNGLDQVIILLSLVLVFNETFKWGQDQELLIWAWRVVFWATLLYGSFLMTLCGPTCIQLEFKLPNPNLLRPSIWPIPKMAQSEELRAGLDSLLVLQWIVECSVIYFMGIMSTASNATKEFLIKFKLEMWLFFIKNQNLLV